MADGARYLRAKDAAAMARARLKAVFPRTKFSVRSSEYSGGSSVDVSWTDGPTRARVRKEIEEYGGAGFDGMIDLKYHHDSWLLRGNTELNPLPYPIVVAPARCSGTEGSRGTVPAFGLAERPEGAELVSFSNWPPSLQRVISPAFAARLVQEIAAYWGGVERIPEISQDADWGGRYKLANPEDNNLRVRPDLDLYWSDAIYRASEDRTLYEREERPVMVVSPEIADAFFGGANGPLAKAGLVLINGGAS